MTAENQNQHHHHQRHTFTTKCCSYYYFIPPFCLASSLPGKKRAFFALSSILSLNFIEKYELSFFLSHFTRGLSIYKHENNTRRTGVEYRTQNTTHYYFTLLEKVGRCFCAKSVHTRLLYSPSVPMRRKKDPWAVSL